MWQVEEELLTLIEFSLDYVEPGFCKFFFFFLLVPPDTILATLEQISSKVNGMSLQVEKTLFQLPASKNE